MMRPLFLFEGTNCFNLSAPAFNSRLITDLFRGRQQPLVYSSSSDPFRHQLQPLKRCPRNYIIYFIFRCFCFLRDILPCPNTFRLVAGLFLIEKQSKHYICVAGVLPWKIRFSPLWTSFDFYSDLLSFNTVFPLISNLDGSLFQMRRKSSQDPVSILAPGPWGQRWVIAIRALRPLLGPLSLKPLRGWTQANQTGVQMWTLTLSNERLFHIFLCPPLFVGMFFRNHTSRVPYRVSTCILLAFP